MHSVFKTRYVLVVILVVVLVASIAYWSKRQLLTPPPNTASPHGGVHLENRPRLDTISLPAAARDHLLDGAFTSVKRNEELPTDCRSTFEVALFPRISSRDSHEDLLANPGEVFQSSDALIKGAPFRRLEFAGLRSNKCFIYYQNGGTMYPRFCVVVIDRETLKILWAAQARKKAQDLDQLREMILNGEFSDAAGPVC